MKDWMKKTGSKKLVSDVKYGSEAPSALSIDAKNSTNLKSNGNYLNNMLKPFRGQSKSKTDEINPYKAQLLIEKKVDLSESKNDLEQILATIEMKVSCNKKHVNVNDGDTSRFEPDRYPLLEKCTSVEILHQGPDKPKIDKSEPKEVKFAADYSKVFQPENDEDYQYSSKVSQSSEIEKDVDEDPVYSSRKLLMRQLLNQELQQIETDDEDERSSTDSWSEMEETFSKIYEPLPAFVGMNSSQHLSKKEILRRVSSPRLRSELAQLSHSELLSYFKDLHHVKSFEVQNKEQFLVEVEVHETCKKNDSYLETSTSEMKLEVQQSVSCSSEASKEVFDENNDSLSWKSISIRSGELGEPEPCYVSRSEILSRTHSIYAARDQIENSSVSAPYSISSGTVQLPFPPVSRNAILQNSFMGKRWKRAELDSNAEEGSVTQDESISSGSCDSWSLDDFEFSDQPISDVNMKSDNESDNWFTRTVIEQEERLRQIVLNEEARNLRKIPSKDSWSYSECEGEPASKISRSQILTSHSSTDRFKLKSVPALELRDRVHNFLAANSQIKIPTKEKVMLILNDHIEHNSNAESLADVESNNKLTRQRLKEALASDWESLSNVSLGFIYVPMEENTKQFKSTKESGDYDTFGSIDSLIFEPKSLSLDSSTQCLHNIDSMSSESPISFPTKASHSRRESPSVPDDRKNLNGDSSSPSVDLDAQLRQKESAENCMTQCLQSSASTESVSHPSNSALESSFFSHLSFSPKKSSDSFGNDEHICTDKVSEAVISVPFGAGSLRCFEISNRKKSSVTTGYHPDDLKRTSCSDETFASSSPDDSISDTESVTSIESVIVNMKIQSSENNLIKKPTAKKKYIVNRCHESDSNSDLDRNSTQLTNLLDSDTSWDYIATPTKEFIKNDYYPSSENFKEMNNGPADFQNNFHGQFADYLANSHFHTTLAEEIHLEDEAKAQYESSDDTPKGTEGNIYEECDSDRFPHVVLLKHHVYQSIESLQSLSSVDAEDSPSFGSVHSEPIYGLTNDRILKSMNGAYVDNNSENKFDEVPFLISKGAVVPLTEEIFKGTQERKKKDLQKDLSREGASADESFQEVDIEVTHSPTTVESDSNKNSNLKMKKVQKVGVSLMGTGNNDLMIQELKQKLRRKFLADDEGSELLKEFSSSLKRSRLNNNFVEALDDSCSVASKREQLAPHIDRIFKSIHSLRSSESRSIVTADEDGGDVENSLIESEESKTLQDGDSVPVMIPSSESSFVYVPTPDYTPISTLPRNSHAEHILPLPVQIFANGYQDDLALNFEDLESFVRNHLREASSANRFCESALATKESRARRARSGSPKRSVRFDTSRKLPELTYGATWSDLESVIFAEDKASECGTYDGSGRPDSRLTGSQMGSKLPGTRMESYKDEWILWDQLSKMRRSKTPEDRERWQSEKTKRMLLWVHLSNNNSHIEWCYKSHWWKAKQRASVAWIIQKCHKNKVPSDFEDPYYKDYEGLEHLKPGIVHRLSNADLYCSALANIYGDPNFHNLSHWNIIQALARKGVYVAEPTDVALTETVLIQTTPIKMSAHLAVIEAMMALYIREVVVAERVVQAIQRISGISQAQDIPTPQDQEEALVLWVEHSTQALQARIHQQVQQTQDQELPVFPKIQDLSDLSDGIGLAALLAFYCPHELSWGDIAVADPPSMADSLYNIGLVIKFCKESLPYNPCLLTKEDIVYMHSSVKQNILAFVAELFFLMELEPVSCVSIANTRKTSSKYIQLSSPGMRPAGVPSVRRSHSMNLNDVSDSRSRAESRSENAPSSHNSDYGGRDSSMSDGQESEFLVQKAKGYATLNDMMRNQSPRPSQHDLPQDFYGSRNMSKEKYNTESKEEELGERSKLIRRGSFHGSIGDLNELPPAGIPTRLEHRPLGRSRSRRNSINADESQLTIENFGGSQDNLNYISRNPDKEPYIHTGKRDSFTEPRSRRSSSQTRDMDKTNDHHRPSLDELDNRIVDKLERDALEREKRDGHYSSREVLLRKDHRRRSQPERHDSSSESEASYEPEKPIGKATSFAELSKIKEQLPGGINIIYMQQQSEKDESNRKTQGRGPEKKTTTFAALPNQTTWKQQSVQNHMDSDGADDNLEPQVVTSELHNVRLKLEEKRRRIEAEKRKMELMMNRQRQKLGKEAFMQAVVKGDLGTEVSNVSKKWLDHETPKEDMRTPDMDAMDYDEYQKSLSQSSSDYHLPPPYRMTDSLNEIQGDIQRLSQQQHQIQALMQNGMANQQNQFYLHDQQGSPARRMWSQHSSSDGYSSMSPATRRAQWGPPARPIMPQGEYMMGGMQQPANYYSYQSPTPMNQPHQLPPLTQLGQPPVQPSQGGFLLHGQPHSLPAGHQPNSVYQNGQTYFSPDQYRGYQNPNYIVDPARGPPQSQVGSVPFRLHQEGGGGDESRGSSSLRSSAQSSPSHQTYQRFQKSPSPSRQVSHAPVAAPPPDDMEPQNVCFIEEQRQNQADVDDKLKRLSISSGSRTYRISHEPGSPTRPPIGTKTFRVPTKRGTPVYDDADLPQPSPPQRSMSPPYNKNDSNDISSLVHVEPLVEGPKADKGFYISLDDEGPKRPKPPLRTKKLYQKKSSGSLTPLTTPTREEASPIYLDQDKESDSVQKSPSYSSLKLRRSSSNRGMTAGMTSPAYPTTASSHFTSRSDITLSPSSSASSVLRESSPSSYWNPQSVSNSGKNLFLSKLSSSRRDYGDLQQNGSDSDSDLAHDDSVKIVHKKSDPKSPHHGMALVIGEDLVIEDSSLSEMEKKKEKLMMMSIRRKQQQEELKRKKEMEADLKREEEKKKEDERMRKKEEEKARRELILERHKIKKAIEEAEKEGRYYNPPAWYYEDSGGTATPNSKSSSVRLRNRGSGGPKPRPKTMHEASFSGSDERLSASRGKKGSSQNIVESSSKVPKSSGRWGSSGSLPRAVGSRGSTGSLGPDYSSSSLSRGVDKGHSGRRPTSVIGGTGSLVRRERSRGSLYGSRGVGLDERDEASYQVHESRRPSVASNRRSRLPCYDGVTGRKYRSTGSLYGQGDHDSLLYHMSEDSGLGRATPPRRAPSPGMSSRHLPSPSGPGSLPPGLFSRRRPGAFDDNMSDISTTSSNMDYCGPRLFKQPTAKSNRHIILNAVEYCVFPGVVNQTSKNRVLEEVGRSSEAKHFLILFRDSGCQFRALYSYNPDLEEVEKLYGTGPKQVTDRMFEKFFKYNSGGKCFSQIHTKHLTVTIDAFTIHNSLWQGKKVNLPSKKDMKLVI